MTAYLCCVGVFDFDAYATGLSSCQSTAPTPDLDASTCILTGFSTS